MDRIYYFDNNGTTQLSQDVSRVMAKVNFYIYGNPSSIYTAGVKAKEVVEDARRELAKLFDRKTENVIFTSGATESNNAVIHSALHQNRNRKRIMISSVEHPSVHNCAKYYESQGYEVVQIPVAESGIDLDFIKENLDHQTALVSVMAVNNETGMIFPVEEIFQIVKAYDSGIICHSDGVQAVGKTDIPVKNVDYLTISAHKFHGPKGVGCIYKNDAMQFFPFIWGGGQERGYRSGTENVSGIAGLGAAAKGVSDILRDKSRLRRYQKKLENALKAVGGYVVCEKAERVSGVTNIGFENIEANQLLLRLNQKGILVSTGSACSSGKIGTSRVIKSMGVPEKYRSTIRISMSKYTSEEDVEYLVEQINEIKKEVHHGSFTELQNL